MKIKKITHQHRRDFSAIMQCEFCNHEQVNNAGYDDRYYHDEVIPKMKCEKCSESTISGNGQINYTETKYPEGYQI